MKKYVVSMLSGSGLLLSQAFAADGFGGVNPTMTPPGSNAPGLIDAVNAILGAAQWIGFIVGIAMIIYIGIKYLTAGAGQKAEVKSTMVPLLVGAVLVMLAPTIAKWLFGMF